MERIKSWIESAGSYETSGNFSNVRERTMSESYRPPSIIRTSNSYDNHDEQFSAVSRNLLSRFECLGLSHEEAVKSVLISPQDRSSYFEALCIRKKHASHYSPTTADLIQSIDQTFGEQLRQIVAQDGALSTTTAATMMMHHVPSCVIKPQEHLHQYHNNPQNQNAHNYYLHQSDPQAQHQHSNINHSCPQSPHRRASTGGMGSGGSTAAAAAAAASGKSRRFFFPESGFFGGRKVKNIDWKLSEAVQQVQSLRLDGSSSNSNTPKNNNTTTSYDPPTPTGMGRLPL
jgi:hypothetical protein